jgi:hypothetical protein
LLVAVVVLLDLSILLSLLFLDDGNYFFGRISGSGSIVFLRNTLWSLRTNRFGAFIRMEKSDGGSAGDDGGDDDGGPSLLFVLGFSSSS